MRINDFSDTGVSFIDPEQYYNQDLHIIETGAAIHAQATLLSADGEWLRMMLARRRTADGGIGGETAVVHLDRLFHGWLERLDRHREILALHNGAELKRDDLCLLRAVLRHTPHKVIAAGAGVSVKAIEKRLHRIREKLEHPYCNCYSVHGCIHWHGLTRLISDEVDWFDPQPTYRVYPGAG